jgi:Tfp pilus assembly protein PilF
MIMISPLLTLLSLVLLGLGGISCSSPRTEPYSTPREAGRNSKRAEQLAREAAEFVETEPEHAEELLREALAADLFCGPAHNNLGVLYLSRSELYEAAHEFEWARRLMPGDPNPRLNLALTLERAGHSGDALQAYNSALEAAPEHVPSKQGLARLLIRTRNRDERLPELLDTIALRGETPEWRSWAQGRLLRMSGREARMPSP